MIIVPRRATQPCLSINIVEGYLSEVKVSVAVWRAGGERYPVCDVRVAASSPL